jgi:hypothetical protein
MNDLCKTGIGLSSAILGAFYYIISFEEVANAAVASGLKMRKRPKGRLFPHHHGFVSEFLC